MLTSEEIKWLEKYCWEAVRYCEEGAPKHVSLTLQLIDEVREMRARYKQFSVGDKVILLGHLSPWKNDPVPGTVGTVVETGDNVSFVEFDGYAGTHAVFNAGLVRDENNA